MEFRYGPPGPEDVEALASWDGPVASLFVPVTAAVPDAAQNPIRHARAVTRALERLEELGCAGEQIEAARRALRPFAEDDSSPAPSVATRAAFWSPAGLRTFGLATPLPEQVSVGGTARLRPVVRAAATPARYRVLALSAKRVVLYEGGSRGLEPRGSGLPQSLEDALGRELSEPSLQYHSSGGAGGRPLYHGQGGAARGGKVDLERFHRVVARALEAELAGDPVPLVLACDEETHRAGLEAALRADVGLWPHGLDGNPDHRSAAALHEAAWPLVAKGAVDARAELEKALAEGPLVRPIHDVVQAVVMGRVRRLWLAEKTAVAGRIDTGQARVEPPWGDEDVLDELAVHVLRRGGRVLVLDELEGDVAAQLR